MESANELSNAPHTTYAFCGFALDVDRAALIYAGESVRLRPQAFDVLRYLVEHHGRLVTKNELISEIWGDAAVTDDSLTHCLIDIRKAIGDTSKKMIKTVSRRGFIFDVPVKRATVSVSWPAAKVQPSSLWKLVASVVAVLGLAFIVLEGSERNINVSLAAASAHLIENEQAQERYLQGWFLFQRRQPGDLNNALDYFQQAIAIDPDNAKAWAGLAGVYRIQIGEQSKVDNISLEKFRAAAQKALILAPDLAEANIRVSQYYSVAGDLESSERYFRRALALPTNDALMLSIIAGNHWVAGQLEEAIDVQSRAVALGPLSRVNHSNLANFLFAAGRYDETLKQIQRLRQIYPESSVDLEFTAIFSFILLHQYGPALAHMERLPPGPDKDKAMAMVYHALGHESKARQAIDSLMLSPDPDTCIRLAELQAFRQDIDTSFVWLAELRKQLDTDLNPTMVHARLDRVRNSPFLAIVRADPRWGNWLAVTNQLLM